MGWTKREIVTQAFEEAGLAAVVFDLQPEQLDSALRRLDSMMATWAGKGINLGYALSSDAEGSDVDDDSGIPTIANEAVYLNLALRIAPGFGKTIQPGTAVAAKDAYDALLTRFAQPQQVAYPSNLPRGAGNRRSRLYGRTYFPIPDTSPIQLDEGGGLTLGD